MHPCVTMVATPIYGPLTSQGGAHTLVVGHLGLQPRQPLQRLAQPRLPALGLLLRLPRPLPPPQPARLPAPRRQLPRLQVPRLQVPQQEFQLQQVFLLAAWYQQQALQLLPLHLRDPLLGSQTGGMLCILSSHRHNVRKGCDQCCPSGLDRHLFQSEICKCPSSQPLLTHAMECSVSLLIGCRPWPHTPPRFCTHRVDPTLHRTTASA
mmetsp:Transcript_18320/g.31002  ORF Transcript_18320/g.31002 Transcript_18320/m.31002 type:complete len:208 (+) Transcript_18320:138-761(+)